MLRSPLLLGCVVMAAAACDPRDPIIELDPDGSDLLGGDDNDNNDGDDDDDRVVGDCTAIAAATIASVRIPLVVPRSRHTATLLDDGRVLLVGGEDDDYLPTAHTEIIDVEAGTSTAGPPLASPRYEHAAVRLGDGSVVVAGGFGPTGHEASIERFDGTSWTTLAPLDAARAGITGLPLSDGRAIFFGGDNDTTIPTTAVVVSVDGVAVAPGVDVGRNRRLHAATTLADGRVFIVGGFFTQAIDTTVLVSADATSSVAGPTIPGARRQAMIAPLTDGGAVVIGGLGSGGVLGDIQRLSATGAGFVSTGELLTPRHSGRAVALGCGVVICGGLGEDGPLDGCEGLDGGGAPVAMTARLDQPMFSFSFTALDDERALIAGGSLPDLHAAEAMVLSLAAP
jgi:hypothetical protein